ncbi:MAG: hypothetical protein LBT44_10060, partial [Clostridiales bacterium]|nr:hypothetical protein [Clostridiales bacterium]
HYKKSNLSAYVPISNVCGHTFVMPTNFGSEYNFTVLLDYVAVFCMFTYWWKGLLFLKLIISIAQVEIFSISSRVKPVSSIDFLKQPISLEQFTGNIYTRDREHLPSIACFQLNT